MAVEDSAKRRRSGRTIAEQSGISKAAGVTVEIWRNETLSLEVRFSTGKTGVSFSTAHWQTRDDVGSQQQQCVDSSR